LAQGGELGRCEQVDQVAPDTVDMARRGRFEATPTFFGEAGMHAPLVIGARGALDQPGLDHLVDAMGHAAARHAHPVGQLRHAEAPVVGLGQSNEDLVLVEVEPGVGLQLMFEPIEEPARSLDQRSPGPLLARIEPPTIGGGPMG